MKHLVIAALLTALAGPVFACADGPDSYRVTGVAAGDALNVRSGPGLGFSVVGMLPHDAMGVLNLDSVPVHDCDGGIEMTPFERVNFWTKVAWNGGEISTFGWVKSRFLAE